ncbi:MAG TPA: (Fe-S)-binding protein, partial [Anaerolineaceae bacterium]|nr:(Fe-S)-binding protein [Anaerolineaceae bacterium]
MRAAIVQDPLYPAEEPVPSILEDPRLRGCIQCGTCGGVCPFGYLMGYPPTRMIAAMRAETFERVLQDDTVWMCVACSACTTACPAQLPITVALMARAKEEMLLAGNVPVELQSALENSQRYGNPMGESPRKRAEWARGIDTPIPITGRDVRQTNVLWFVGDYAAFHPRVQPATQAFARLLQILGIQVAMLGTDESSDGDSQRLAGERGLFEMLVEKNLRAFRKVKFEQIVTTDPHAYNAIKNYFPTLGGAYSVKHYTEFLADHLGELRP